MESRDQAFGVKPSGMGMRNLIATPMAMEAASGTSFAPCKHHDAFIQTALKTACICVSYCCQAISLKDFEGAYVTHGHLCIGRICKI